MPICESIRWPMRVRNVRYGSCNGSPMIRVKPREHLDEEQREDRLRTRCDVGDDVFSYHHSSLSLMMGCVKKSLTFVGYPRRLICIIFPHNPGQFSWTRGCISGDVRMRGYLSPTFGK